MKTIVGLFSSDEEATGVAHDLEALGIPSDDITIANNTRLGPRDKCGRESILSERGIAAAGASGFGWLIAGLIPLVANRSRRGAAAIGASLGGGLGLVMGLIMSSMKLSTPIVAGSATATTLVLLALGAFAGALAAALFNMGISHERVPLCEESFREHGVVVAARVDQRTEPGAVRVMNEHGARNLRVEADAWLASGSTVRPEGEDPYPSDSSVRSHEPPG